MEINQQIIKNTLYFLGLIFIVCGAILIFFNLYTLPSLYYFMGIIPELIHPILIISIGVAISMISKAL